MPQSGPIDDRRYLRCDTSGRSFAIPLSLVRSIERTEAFQPVQSTDEFLGTLQFLDQEIPVLSLARLLDLSEEKIAAAHIIVLGDGSSMWGLLVERTMQLTQIQSRDLHPIPSYLRRRISLYFGLIRIGSDILPILDPRRLYSDDPKLQSFAPPPAIEESFDLLAPTATQNQLVLCSLFEPENRVRPIRFAFSALQILEMLDLPKVIPIPKLPAEVRGIIEWQKRFVPLVDICERLGLPSFQDSGRSRALVLRPSKLREPIAILIQPTVRLLDRNLPHVPCERSLPLRKELTQTIVEFRDQTVALLDADRFV